MIRMATLALCLSCFDLEGGWDGWEESQDRQKKDFEHDAGLGATVGDSEGYARDHQSATGHRSPPKEAGAGVPAEGANLWVQGGTGAASNSCASAMETN
jgi:hypothetical protein